MVTLTDSPSIGTPALLQRFGKHPGKRQAKAHIWKHVCAGAWIHSFPQLFDSPVSVLQGLTLCRRSSPPHGAVMGATRRPKRASGAAQAPKNSQEELLRRKGEPVTEGSEGQRNLSLTVKM